MTDGVILALAGVSGAAGPTGPTGPTGPSGSGGLPFTDEGSNSPFTLDTVSHAYRSTNSESTVEIDLPPASTAGEQIYVVETHGSSLATLVPDGTDFINGQNSSVSFSQ